MQSEQYEDLFFELRKQLPRHPGEGWKDEWVASQGFALKFFHLRGDTPLLEVPMASQVVPRACRKGRLANLFNPIFFSLVVSFCRWIKQGTMRSVDPGAPWQPRVREEGPVELPRTLSLLAKDSAAPRTFSLTEKHPERKIALQKDLGRGSYGVVVQADLELPVGHPLLEESGSGGSSSGGSNPSPALRLIGFHDPEKGRVGWLRFHSPSTAEPPQEAHLLLPVAIKFEHLSGSLGGFPFMARNNPSNIDEAVLLCALQQMPLRGQSPGFPLFYGSLWLGEPPDLEKLARGPAQATVMERMVGSAETVLYQLLNTEKPPPLWFLVGNILMQVVFAYSAAHHQFWLQHDDLRLANLLVRDASVEETPTLDLGYSSTGEPYRCQAVTDLSIGQGLGEVVLADFGVATARLPPRSYRSLTPFKLQGAFLPHVVRQQDTFMEVGPSIENGNLFKVFKGDVRRRESTWQRVLDLVEPREWDHFGMSREELQEKFDLLWRPSRSVEELEEKQQMLFTQRTSLLHLITDLAFAVVYFFSLPGRDGQGDSTWLLMSDLFPEAVMLATLRARLENGNFLDKEKMQHLIGYIMPAFFPDYRIGGFLESERYEEFAQRLSRLQEDQGQQLFRYHTGLSPQELKEAFHQLVQDGKRAFLYEEE